MELCKMISPVAIVSLSSLRFQEDNPDQKFQDIISAVVSVVSTMCSCTFTQDNIQNYEFSCRSIENTVVFRAEIVYASFAFTATRLVDVISQWVQSAPSLVVGYRLPNSVGLISVRRLRISEPRKDSKHRSHSWWSTSRCMCGFCTRWHHYCGEVRTKKKTKVFRVNNCDIAVANCKLSVLLFIRSLLLALKQKKLSSLRPL